MVCYLHSSHHWIETKTPVIHQLVGSFNPFEKYCQNGSSPHVGVNKKHLSNHHPVNVYYPKNHKPKTPGTSSKRVPKGAKWFPSLRSFFWTAPLVEGAGIPSHISKPVGHLPHIFTSRPKHATHRSVCQ